MESLHCFFVFGWIKLKLGVRNEEERISDEEEAAMMRVIMTSI